MMLNRLFATRSSVSRSYNYSVLTQAIASGNVDRAIDVMNNSPELINDTDKFGNSALHVAVQLESDVLVRELIARSANIDATNCLGFSPHAWATKIRWDAGVELMASATPARGSGQVTQSGLVNFAVSERTYKKLRYKMALLLSLGFLIYATYSYVHFFIDVFIDAKEMVDHGMPTHGVVTSIYKGTTTGWTKRPYWTATVTYLGGHKIYIDGKNLREGQDVYLTYSELHPYMAKVRSFNDSFLDYAAWRSESYLLHIVYVAVFAVLWGIWVACFKSYRKGKLISGSDLSDFFVEDKLLPRILAITGITRLIRKPTSKSQETQRSNVASTSTTDTRPVAAKDVENNVTDDVPNNLRQLQKLLQEGVINEAEFNEKKRELLQRL